MSSAAFGWYSISRRRPVRSAWPGAAEINGRFADKDEISGLVEPHTGGWVTYVTPGIKYAPTDAVGLAGGVQIPIHQDLFGIQDEDPVFIVGLAYDWR